MTIDLKRKLKMRNGWRVKDVYSNGKVILGKFENIWLAGKNVWYSAYWTLHGKSNQQKEFDLIYDDEIKTDGYGE